MIKPLSLIPLALITGCSTKEITVIKKIPVYCEYIPIPSVQYTVPLPIDIEAYIDSKGMVQGLRGKDLENLINKVHVLNSTNDSKDVEIAYYQEHIKKNNMTCTNPLDRSTFKDRI